MAARKKEKLINLLPKEEFAGSTAGRILAWTLSTFRFIVIITELIVVAAFLSRFWLDAKITDLNDEIKQKSAIISSFNTTEKKFRQVQLKLTAFAKLTTLDNPISITAKNITSYLPNDVLLSSFLIYYADKKATLNGFSFTEISISQFINNLESSNLFDSITLDSVSSSKDNSSLIFTISIKIK